MPVTGSKHTYYNLSIRVKADGFSFLVTEGLSGDNLLCEEFTISAEQTLESLLTEKIRMHALQQYGFSRVRVITQSDATCLPRQEFVAEELADVYSLVFPTFDREAYEVCYTHLPQLDIVEVFLVSKSLMETVRAVYPDATFTNSSALILGRVATYCKRQQLPDNVLFAYTTPIQLYLFSISENKLKFANSFPLDQPQDSLYYLLSVWKVLGLNARKNQCYVAGENGSVDYLTEALTPYLQHVETLPISIES